MCDPELHFFYYLSDANQDVVGVLSVNGHLAESLLFRGYTIRLVSEVEHDTMIAFGLPNHTHDIQTFPFLYSVHGHIHDTRT